MRYPLLFLLRMVKRVLFTGGRRYRRIKHGIARGMVMPIDRRSEFRCELGLFEPAVAEPLRRFTRDARVAYDVGSHLGYYTLAFACLGVDRIFSFEPNDEAREQLHETVLRNGITDRVHIMSYAVGRRSEGRVRSVDQLVAGSEIDPPDVIKMDIDGGEVEALEGMREVLTAAGPKLVIEVHSADLEAGCRQLLEELGFSSRIVDAPRWMRGLFPETRPIELNRWLLATPAGDSQILERLPGHPGPF